MRDSIGDQYIPFSISKSYRQQPKKTVEPINWAEPSETKKDAGWLGRRCNQNTRQL